MTALPTDYLYPPPGGWTLADVRALPEKCRVEVLDGALIVNPSPLPIHQRIMRRLAAALEPALSPEWQLEVDIDVLLEEEPLDYVAPDIVVFSATVPLTTRPIPAGTVLLAVEVVSKGSRREDRGSKPLAYAEAGVPHYWRLESQASGALAPVMHTYVLDVVTGTYTETGVHHDRLRSKVIGPVDIDLAALTR
ncbi:MULTISPECIES: Uma2 family endonuclease [unclassified Crossiella]|uniref:Uma2 family endonuclease n=1 Tax=unclassified Crossiella TaxID=2620835 RepID=UPI0024954005|nr:MULTISPECIES: Uma2 family endonuclease [unclassified Crossiella]